MPKHRFFAMKFARIYPLHVQKAERKGRTKEEVDQIICWLTGRAIYAEEIAEGLAPFYLRRK